MPLREKLTVDKKQLTSVQHDSSISFFSLGIGSQKYASLRKLTIDKHTA